MDHGPAGKEAIKGDLHHGSSANHGGGGGRVAYPRHVWSPSGGWYGQPKNWKSNTAIMLGVMLAVTLVIGKVSSEREVRTRMPPPDAVFPSRYISKQIREHERQERQRQKEQAESGI